MLEKIKKENPVILYLKIGSALIAILEDKGLFPQNSFMICFFAFAAIYIISIIGS